MKPKCKDCKHWKFTPEQADEKMHECARIHEASVGAVIECDALSYVLRLLTEPEWSCEGGEWK